MVDVEDGDEDDEELLFNEVSISDIATDIKAKRTEAHT